MALCHVLRSLESGGLGDLGVMDRRDATNRTVAGVMDRGDVMDPGDATNRGSAVGVGVGVGLGPGTGQPSRREQATEEDDP